MRVRDPRLLVVLSAAMLGAAIALPLGVIASHQFTDVLNTNSFHGDIDAIADAGITTGCGGGKYCPKDFVTREQMAAFLNRLGALGPGKTPVVNATKVDGFDAASINRFAYGQDTGTTALTWPARLVYGSVTITAPASGYVLVNTSVTIFSNTCAADCTVVEYVRHVEGDDLSIASQAYVGSRYVTLSTTTVFDVAPGPNTFRIELAREEFAEDLYGYWAQITAQFSPFAEGTILRAQAPTKPAADMAP